MSMELIRSFGCERIEARGERFTAVRNDCVLELEDAHYDERLIGNDSVDMILTSIPFGNQYEYSPSFNDFGHNLGDDEFFAQMEFLVPDLLRVLKPGRICAVHVKDRIRFGNVTGKGMPTVSRFSDKTADCFERLGFEFMARITIDTDVVRENNQTYRLGWSENAKDSSKMGAGMPEYVLVLRKLPTDLSDAYADVPVTKAKVEEWKFLCPHCGHTEPEAAKFLDITDTTQAVPPFRCQKCNKGFAKPDVSYSGPAYTRADWQIDAAGFWRSSGNRLPDPEVLVHWSMEDIKRLWIEYSHAGGYSHAEHVALAKALEGHGKLPSSFMLFPPVSRNKDVWTDIARMRTLNTEQSRKGMEKHVCPLQLDVIERLITRYTNRGELVLDPFAGIFSVPYQAIKMGRKGYGIELNEDYWRFGVGYCEMAEAEQAVPTLFDLGTELATDSTEVEA